MTGAVWPQPGRCGACAQPAHRYPSGRWEHAGRPCRARTQTAWGVDDAAFKRELLRFVPDGEPLPTPRGWCAESTARARAWMRYETDGGAS